MKTLEVRTADGRCVARQVRLACSFRSRCVGLLRHTDISEHTGLLLIPGGSVHTLGMRFAIDVVFLSRQMKVLELAERVPPWRFVIAPRDTAQVLELAAGRIGTIRLTKGTFLTCDAGPTGPGGRPRVQTTACERMPIQFSLRLPLDRRCPGAIDARCNAGDRRRCPRLRSASPYRRRPDSRAAMTPSGGS
jgi:uncharacterized membrane protein (UPF0127 family)